MRSDIELISMVISATLATACSSTPRTAAPEAGTTARLQPAPQTLAAAGNAPTTSGNAPAAAGVSASEVDASLVKAGYSVMKRHDPVLYCRNEIITGQRIGTRVCLTAAQIHSEKQDVAKAKDLLNNHANRCMGGPECTQ
jgi:hypothetical protein